MGALVWDERLIGQAEAYQLAGDWPWRAGIRSGVAYVDCGKCGQAILVLGAASAPFTITTDAFVGAVLRHGVCAHDLILNRKNRPGGPPDGHGLRDRGSAADPGGGDGRAAQDGPAGPGRHRRRADRGASSARQLGPYRTADRGSDSAPGGGQ